MVAQADKRLLWHPRGQNKFVVGGSTQITLYEWLPQSSQIKQVASQLELNTMKVCMPIYTIFMDSSPRLASHRALSVVLCVVS